VKLPSSPNSAAAELKLSRLSSLVEAAGEIVGPISDCLDALWPVVGGKAAPAELVAADARHMAATLQLYDTVPASWASLDRLECFLLCFFQRPHLCCVALAGEALVPHAAMCEAGLPPALAALHYGCCVAAIVELSCSAVWMGAPEEIWESLASGGEEWRGG
jgi:hypothetical protein